MTFDQFSFDQRIDAGIRFCDYETPTPIQARAIPEILKGRDVMGLAQTGTGKTAAFALPILQRLLDARAKTKGPVRTLILAPTRELALQIHENIIELGMQTGIRCAAVFGGVGFNPQIKAARQATIVVACPGRLIDLINKKEIRLDKVDTLVLDEADRMLDMGFLPDIKRIISNLPERRQNLLFSATMPRDIRKLADRILADPTTVQVANTDPAKSISHAFYPVKPHRKSALLEALLKATDHESVLVFSRTKYKAKNLAKKLDRRGFKATFLQGNMSQNARQRALEGFRNGTFKIMVATDIAARGIDCDRISHVINLDMPDSAETYTHRIGRTGRADRSGEALSFISREDDQIVRQVERIVKGKIERLELEGFDYDKPPTKNSGGQRRQGPGNRNHGQRSGGNRSRFNKGGNRGRGRQQQQ